MQHAVVKGCLLELSPEEQRVDLIVLVPGGDGQRPHRGQELFDVLAALEHFRHRRIRQLIVPGVQALVAAADRIFPIPPRVVIAGHGAQGGGIGLRRCEQDGDEREGHGSSWRRARQDSYGSRVYTCVVFVRRKPSCS